MTKSEMFGTETLPDELVLPEKQILYRREGTQVHSYP